MYIENVKHQCDIVAGWFNYQGIGKIHQYAWDCSEFSVLYHSKSYTALSQMKTMWQMWKKIYDVDPENVNTIPSHRQQCYMPETPINKGLVSKHNICFPVYAFKINLSAIKYRRTSLFLLTAVIHFGFEY